MSKYYSKNSFPVGEDFNCNITINKIQGPDYNIIRSKSNYSWIKKPTKIHGYDNKYYKISSQLPKLQDTTSFSLMNKVFDFRYSNDIPKDTMDMMLIRQNIDKKQRYDLLNNKKLRYGKYTLPSRRFI